MNESTTNAAYKHGVNLGTLSALAVRFESDDAARAERLKALHNTFLAVAVANAEQSPAYDAMFAVAYRFAFDFFNQPIEIEVASAMLKTVTTTLCQELLA